VTDPRRWNTAGDCEINDDLQAEGLPLPGDPPLPAKYGLESGNTAETYYKLLTAPPRRDGKTDEREGAGSQGSRTADRARTANGDSGRCPPTRSATADRPASTASRPISCGGKWPRRIDETSLYTSDISMPWRRWARATLTPKVDYMATIRHAVRRALRDKHRPAATTAPTSVRIAVRPATATSSCRASTSRDRGPVF